jgi:HK97 family phage portal protein
MSIFNRNIFSRSKSPAGSEGNAKTEKQPENEGLGLPFYKFFSDRSCMLLSAVYRCVNVISDSIAQLPVKTYIERDSYFYEYREHPVYNLLYGVPNRNTGRFVLIKNMVCDMLLHGNGYAFIERDSRSMRPEAVHCIPVQSVLIQYDANNPVFPECSTL